MEEQSPFKKTLKNLRRAVNMQGLDEQTAGNDPFALFGEWIKAAVEKTDFEPNAMTLATCTKDGYPTARTVLLKDFSHDGFTFYTNYDSRKGKQLAENPHASLVFHWPILMRQVLIEGVVSKLDYESSAEYFHMRPRGSQLAAYVSPQSQPVDNRDELTDKMLTTEKMLEGKEIPCPKEWGGYILNPSRIEFWQGRADRMHDRLCYSRSDGSWKRVRLAP